MANIKSNEKRHLQDTKKHLLNHIQMSKLKTQIKKVQKTKSKEELAKLFSLVDSSLSKGIITKNKADRIKSRISLFLSGKKQRTELKVEKKQKPVKKEIKIKEESLKRESEQLKVVHSEPKKDSKQKEVVEQTSIIMISTTPKYANLILDDEEKNVFFYKVTPINKVKRVLIYATAPVKAVVGEFDLESINISTLSTAWNKYRSQSAMSKKEFDSYYEGKKEAHAMISKESFRYSKPKKLEQFGMSKGPSGFQYLK